jgi:hypothetical protein
MATAITPELQRDYRIIVTDTYSGDVKAALRDLTRVVREGADAEEVVGYLADLEGSTRQLQEFLAADGAAWRP